MSAVMTGNDAPPQMSTDERAIVIAWVRDQFADFVKSTANKPLVTDASKSKAIRIRWFDVNIQNNAYLVGLNVHWGHAAGACWLKNAGGQVVEMHPHLPPQHQISGTTISWLVDNVIGKSKFADIYAQHSS